jgi:hypothetical protein
VLHLLGGLGYGIGISDKQRLCLELLMGKGSAPRPIPNPEKFRDNWDQIFGKKEKEKK